MESILGNLSLPFCEYMVGTLPPPIFFKNVMFCFRRPGIDAVPGPLVVYLSFTWFVIGFLISSPDKQGWSYLFPFHLFS